VQYNLNAQVFLDEINVCKIVCRYQKNVKISAMDEWLQLISVFATTTTIHGWAWYTQTENKETQIANLFKIFPFFPNIII